MTQEEFDNYRFSIITEINYFEDRWDRVVAVDFECRMIAILMGKQVELVDYIQVKGIRESNAK